MTEIKLKFDLVDLRDIYFGERHQIYFFGPRTKRQSVFFVIALIGFPFLSWYSLQSKDNVLFFFAAVILAFLSYDFWRVSQPIIKWKKSVEFFLKKTATVKEAKIIYTDEYISYSQDGDETKLNWGIVSQATINDRSIVLSGSSNLIFPRSAMSQPEFNTLSKAVMTYVANVKKSN